MPLQSAKSIQKTLMFPIPLTGINMLATTSTFNATAIIGTALATAGNNGAALLNQVSATTGLVTPDEQFTQGIVVTAGYKLPVYISGSDSILTDPVSGEEIYAILTTAAGVHTLTFYLRSGAIYTFAANTTVDTYFYYNANISLLPSDFAVRIKRMYSSDDPTAVGGREVRHYLAVAALNTIPATFSGNVLQFIPIVGSVSIVHNGWYGTVNAGDITVAGQAVTWNAATAGFPLNIGDNVELIYRTLQP